MFVIRDRPACWRLSDERRTRRVQRRAEAEGHCGQQGDRERDDDEADIHDGGVERKHPHGTMSARTRVPTGASAQAECGAGQREQRAFGDELTDDSAACRSQRRAHRQLAAPVERAQQAAVRPRSRTR